MGARTDNTGPASPVRCIGGKTVACFQLRSPDRVPLLGASGASGRATSGHRAGTSRSSRSGSSPRYSDLSDDKEGVEPSASGRRDRKLEQFTVHTRGPAMGTSDDSSDEDDARDATMFAKGDGRAPWEAASFFGWSNRLRGKNKKGRSRDRHACPDPRHCGPSQSRPTPRWWSGWWSGVCALVVAAGGPFGAGLALGYTRAAYNTLVCSELEKPGFESLMDCDGGAVDGDDLVNLENSLLAGAVFGAMFGGWAMDAMGRRGALRVSGTIAAIGWLAIPLGGADSALALIGRALTGAAAGMSSAVTPALVAETATKASRGQLVAFGQLAFSFGVLTQIAVALIGTWVDYGALAVAGAVYSAAYAAAVGMAPESPRWFASRDNSVGVHRSLAALRALPETSAEVEEEAKKMMHSVRLTPPVREDQRFSVLNFCTQRHLSQPLLAGFTLMAVQQLGGLCSLAMHGLNYSMSRTHGSPDEVAAVFTTSQAFGCVACMWFLGESGPGRRIALLVSLAGATAANLVIAITLNPVVFGANPVFGSGAADGAVVVQYVAATAFAWFHAAGLGTIPWLVAVENFPQYARGTGVGLIAGARWYLALCLRSGFHSLVAQTGGLAVFTFFGVVTAAGLSALAPRGQKLAPPEADCMELEEVHAWEEVDLAAGKYAYLP